MNPSPGAKAASRHELDDTALGKWLLDSKTIPGLKLPVVSTKIGYGQSNPTYFVDDAAYVVKPRSDIASINETNSAKVELDSFYERSHPAPSSHQ